MASSSGTSLEQRRWLVVGIALQNVLTTCLRDKIQNEMTPFYQYMVRSFAVDKQTFAAHQKTIPPSTVKLNYGSINNNAALHPSPRHYDYCVKDEASLAKLFMKPFMAHFNAFDSSFDTSAALAVLCGAPPFTAMKAFAEDVRSKVRNEWAHCDFPAWTEAHYHDCFDLMDALVRSLTLPPGDERRILDGLKLWRNQGLEICLGKPLDDALLNVIHNEVQTLSNSLDDYKGKQDKDLESVCSTLALFKSEFYRSIVSLKEEQSNLKETCQDLKCKQDEMNEEMTLKDKEQKDLLRTSEIRWQLRQEQVESLCKALEVKRSDMQRDLDVLRSKMNNLSFSEDSKEVLFDAPEQNKWFTGRVKEVDRLEKLLPFKSSNGLIMAAICGLGGCGKTTLAAHFAWKRKPDYDGGVFWVSMEDERKFENSMNDLALRLGVLADSFDLTLSKVLNCISQRKKAWLLVLDDVDQLNLSDEMRKVLSGRWKRQATGHLLLTTRREPTDLCNSVDLNPSCCVEVFSFSEDEAKNFFLIRSGICDVAGQEEALDELVQALGGLPLALEQAAAHISALRCRIGVYLEQYKGQRLKLLSQHPAKPSWEYESQSRLAVHTTWLINFEYVKRSPLGDLASAFVEAAAFLAPHEIEEDLVNVKLLSIESPSKQSGDFSIARNEIMDTLAKFSLFQRKSARSLSLHRMVQEVIRSRMSNEEIASSMLKAIQLLHHSFQGCPSPDQILTAVIGSVQGQASASVADLSEFHLWSKLTSHASELQYHLKSLLDKQDIKREVKTVVLTHETSRVVYENAVKLSVQGHQEEAKQAERFAFQILDSGSSDCVALSFDELRKLFPHTLPLSQVLQKIILYSSQPPVENQKLAMFEDPSQDADIEAIRLQGNAFFKEARFKEAVDTYSRAITASKATENMDPRLLNNRATAYLKLEMYEKCLQDSDDYINMMPNCWKGYSRKALALNGLGRKRPALCFAAIAFYHDTNCCRRYETFRNAFGDLDRKWEVVDSSKTLQDALRRNVNSEMRKKVLLMRNGQYEIESFKEADLMLDINIAALVNDSSVTIKSESLKLNKNCCFQRINFQTEQGVDVEICSNVEFDHCEFHCNSVDKPAVTVYGTATFHGCKISNSQGGGIVVRGRMSFASLKKCNISGNGNKPLHSSGINVFDEGTLVVHECHVHGNTEGILIGTPYDAMAKEVKVTNSEIYDNKYEGVAYGGRAHWLLTVTIKRNKIYHNGGYGFRVSSLMNIDNNMLLFQENTVFGNFWWGVWVQCNSGGIYKKNKIFNNKMGGMRVGKRSPGMPACVVEGNVIHDNCGPAFHEGLRHFEFYSFPLELQKECMQVSLDRIRKQMSGIGWSEGPEIPLPNAVSAEFKLNRCFQNETGKTKQLTKASVTNCAYCFRTDCPLKSCKRCMTTRYCGKTCQTCHWGRHKYLCHAAGQISAIEVSIPVCPPDEVTVTFSLTNPGLEPTGPSYASPPPRDGSRFIVKLQTGEGLIESHCLDHRGYVSDDFDPNKASIGLYDRSRNVDFFFAGQPRIYHLIMECGLMGASMYLSKKLFCWAAFKDGKTIRIFTHEFPPVQKW